MMYSIHIKRNQNDRVEINVLELDRNDFGSVQEMDDEAVSRVCVRYGGHRGLRPYALIIYRDGDARPLWVNGHGFASKEPSPC